MKVDVELEEKVEIGSLGYGDCFFYSGVYYMVCNLTQSSRSIDIDENVVGVVGLAHGSVYIFSKSTLVIPCKLKVVKDNGRQD